MEALYDSCYETNEEYFDYIIKGTKEYEIRLNDEKRSVIKKVISIY